MITEIVNGKDYWHGYYLAKPEPFLRRFIDCFWENKAEFSEDEILTVRSLPDIGFTIRINLAGHYYIKRKGVVLRVSDDILFPRNFTWNEFYVKEPKVFGIKFRFSFLPYTIGTDHRHFTGAPTDLKRLLSPSFVQSLHGAACFQERVNLATQYFERIYDESAKTIKRYEVVLQLLDHVLFNDRYDFKVNEMAKEKFLSGKTLNRYFRKNIGLSVKQAFRILRTRKAIESYVKGNEFSVYDWGYYDYSHFFRDVMTTTGLNLSQIRQPN